jgi:hypothetical protein
MGQNLLTFDLTKGFDATVAGSGSTRPLSWGAC